MMMNYYGNYWGGGFNPFSGFLSGLIGLVVIPLVFWSLFWKGWALWRAVKNDSKPWFIVLLVVNTLGLLEILYIFVFGKKKSRRK